MTTTTNTTAKFGPKLIGNRIVKVMTERRMSRNDLAIAAGSHRPHISSICSGKSMPSLPLLRRIADALGCRLRDLVDPIGDDQQT